MNRIGYGWHMNETADETIARLTRDNEGMAKCIENFQERADCLTRENAALREALEMLVNGAVACPTDHHDSGGWEYRRIRLAALEKARAALEGTR